MPKTWKELTSIKPNAHTEKVIDYLCLLDDDGSDEGIGFCRTVTPLWDECRDVEETVRRMRSLMPPIPVWLEVDQTQVQWERVFIEFYLGDRLTGDDDDFTTMKRALDRVTLTGLMMIIIIGMVKLIIDRL